eukprot:1149633-Pelagomonas_calceolata.AAC.5
MAGTSQAGSQQQQQQQPVQAAAPHPKAGSSQPPAKKREQAPSADDPFGLEGLMSGAGELGSGGGGGGSGTGHSGGGHEAAEDDDPFSLNSFFEPKVRVWTVICEERLSHWHSRSGNEGERGS